MRALKISGVTPSIIEVGKYTLLAEDLRRPGVVETGGDIIPWVFTDIDAQRAVVKYEIDGKPAGLRLLESRSMREKWLAGEDVRPLQSVTEFKAPSRDELLNKRCENLVEALRDKLLLLFSADEADALFAFQLHRKPDGLWVEAGLRSNRRDQRSAVNLGKAPTAEDFAKAEKDMLIMFGVIE